VNFMAIKAMPVGDCVHATDLAAGQKFVAWCVHLQAIIIIIVRGVTKNHK